MPDRLDLGHQRQEHRHPADHPHPAAGRPARRDDDLGRRPRRRADGRAGRLDRARRRAADPRAGRDIDVAVLETARGGIVLRGIGYESNDASVLTNVSSDHLDLQGIHTLPELAEVKADDLPDHEARRLGRAQRRRPARRRRRAGGSGRASRSSRWTRTARRRGRPPPRRPAAAARTSCATAGWSRSTGRRRRRSSRSPRIPITIGGLARHNVANALAAAGGARGLGATDRAGRATGCVDFRPSTRALAGPAQPVPARVSGS